MRLPRITGAALVLILLPCRGQASRADDGRELLSLDRGWRFFAGEDPRAAETGFDDRSWQPVDLPHTWNALDGQDGGGDYRRGPGWYRRHLALDASYAGRRLYLQFDGASLMADVYVNGIHLGNHKGGFARFRFDATAALHTGADNVVAVRVDNGQLGIPPTSGDFTFFGGLYRSVWLLATDPVQISAMDLGSPGVFVEQSRVGPASATFVVRAELRKQGCGPAGGKGPDIGPRAGGGAPGPGRAGIPHPSGCERLHRGRKGADARPAAPLERANRPPPLHGAGRAPTRRGRRLARGRLRRRGGAPRPALVFRRPAAGFHPERPVPGPPRVQPPPGLAGQGMGDLGRRGGGRTSPS